MKEKLIKQAEALSDELRKIERDNPAAWKARRKVEAAIDVLEHEWPKEPAKSETAKGEPAKP